ncbi:MAG: tRNA (N6-isopentenyl adenosine(37)-C2)-methylthiotransferase MiaB [Candidatus Eisenbacteria sp.]|nr:tRNA (N6-isopentenyl adenosine(37)-C2)-methylthiotransferase MiaB [Candidatus Eisenbacteria bacterium]
MSDRASRTFFIETLGCQMNVYDSELLRRRFLQEGYRAAAAPEQADVILVNSCSVRRKAEARAWARISLYTSIKGRPGSPLVVLCGCVASRATQGLGEGSRGRPALVAGCGSYDSLLAAVEAGLSTRENGGGPVLLDDSPSGSYRMPVTDEPSPLRAFISISRGCDSHCTYCVVPSARGPHRSRSLDDITEEAHRLVEGGTRDVTLLGQNVNVYQDRGANFLDVLAAMEKVPGLWRVRFTSSHPRDMTVEVLRFIGRAENVCEHLHLPLQAGCDATLRAMHRGYTVERYRELVETARAEIPGVAISTDLMVGFPGETDENFEESLRFVSEIGFAAAFTFIYSARPGTPASGLPDQVPEDIKRERLERLLQEQNAVTDALGKRMVGHEVEVLVEGRDRKDPRKLSGRTRTNRLVSFEGDPQLVGSLVKVRIESAGRWTAFGRRPADSAT